MLFSKLLKSIVNTFVSTLIVNYIMLKELLFLYLAITSGSLSSLLYAFHKEKSHLFEKLKKKSLNKHFVKMLFCPEKFEPSYCLFGFLSIRGDTNYDL